VNLENTFCQIHPNLPMGPDWIIRFYNQRGTAEQHIKEGKQAINWTRLSCMGMAQNEVRLQLHALAYNLGVIPSVSCWVLLGTQLRRILNVNWKLRIFNITAALLLLASLYPILMPH